MDHFDCLNSFLFLFLFCNLSAKIFFFGVRTIQADSPSPHTNQHAFSWTTFPHLPSVRTLLMTRGFVLKNWDYDIQKLTNYVIIHDFLTDFLTDLTDFCNVILFISSFLQHCTSKNVTAKHHSFLIIRISASPSQKGRRPWSKKLRKHPIIAGIFFERKKHHKFHHPLFKPVF